MMNSKLSPTEDMLRAVTRRYFFKQAGFGIGAAALSSLLDRFAFAGAVEAFNILARQRRMRRRR